MIFEGRLTKADGTAYVNADEVALTNNAIMHPFSRIKCHLSNQLIESLYYLGQATTMLGLLNNLSVSNQTFSRVYGNAALFRVKFFGKDVLKIKSNITPSDYKTLYPLFTFNVSKQKQKLKTYVVDIQIKANITENGPANTRAFALVISDKMLSFQSDGNKMSVIY